MDGILESLSGLIEELKGHSFEPSRLREKAVEIEAGLRGLRSDQSPPLNFKEFFDHLPEGICVTNGEGLIQYVNPAYVAETGVPADMILGRYADEIADEGIYFKDPVSLKVIRSRKAVALPGTKNAYGSHKGAYVIGVPVFERDGKIKNVIVNLFNTSLLHAGYEEFKRSINRGESIRIVDGSGSSRLDPMIGDSPGLQEIRKIARRVAPTDTTVLITGESGVGKETVADLIYDSSSRRGQPYVKINCAAIPPNLLEAELFGYERGAFTGADPRGKTGLLGMANHGTILLDEIGDFPMELQPKLLRALQQGTIYRIGGDSPIKLDVRVIAATNSNLKEKIAARSFREDLYYRLSVIPIYVPPLRERRGDIAVMVRHFFALYCDKHKRALAMPDGMMDLLERYSWPGNVRELQNIIEYMVVCADEVDELDLESLRKILSVEPSPEPEEETLFRMRDGYERLLIERALRQTGSLRGAARLLKVYPSSLYRKIQKYGIDAASLKAAPDGEE